MNNRINRYNIVFCALVGVAVFLLIYGVRPLDVTYDDWIFNGYVETDILQHYAGWLAYRNTGEIFPLTFTDYISFPYGDYASLADGIPLAMLLFKLIDPILPATFQFFGILICLSFILQSVCGGLLIGEFTQNRFSIVLSGAVFCLSPIMIERAFRHTALSFHFLILLAILLYFKARREPSHKIFVGFALLIMLSVTLHLYFTPMIVGFALAALLDVAVNKKVRLSYLLIFLAGIVGAFILCYLLGFLGLGINNTSGYGSMGMNLNALFNPTSLDTNWWVPGQGRLDWSLFLPMRALSLNNIESFNYLGMGVLVTLFAAIVFLLFNFKCKIQCIIAFLKKHPFLIGFAAFSTLFAVTNTVSAFSYTLFTVPLPQMILDLFDVFRASGRMFWSVNYLIVFGAIIFLITLTSKRRFLAQSALALLLVIQLVDLIPALSYKHDYFEKTAVYKNPDAEKIVEFMDDTDIFYTLELREDRIMSVYLYKQDKKTNIHLISRDGYMVDELMSDMQNTYNLLLEGVSPYNATYFTTEFEKAEQILEANPDLEMTSTNEGYILRF